MTIHSKGWRPACWLAGTMGVGIGFSFAVGVPHPSKQVQAEVSGIGCTRATVDRDSGYVTPEIPYPTQPFSTAPDAGAFGAGMALVDFNGDRFPDMVVSSGIDVGTQPVGVFYNSGNPVTPFNTAPTLQSKETDCYGGLATGDIDGDGRLDLVVTMTGRKNGSYCGSAPVQTANAIIFLGGRLEKGRDLELKRRGLACALGDVNGDGRLDLAVAWASFPDANSSRSEGEVRVYLNDGGTLRREADWVVPTPGTDVRFADLNGDGSMDLLVASEHTLLFQQAKADVEGPVPLDRNPTIFSRPDCGPPGCYSYGVDYAKLAQGRPVSVVSAFVRNSSNLESLLCVYAVPSSTETGSPSPAWCHEFGTDGPSLVAASRLLLADMNGDKLPDLAVGQWGLHSHGGPLWVFPGTGADVPFRLDSGFKSETQSVLQGLDVADTRRRCLKQSSYSFTASRRWFVVTLPERRISAILGVRKNGQVLDRGQYAWAPGENWISLPIETNDSVVVDYETSNAPDLAAAGWAGNYVFYSLLACSPE